MPSFEFVRKWFIEAVKEAKRQGRKDSAALWKDGLDHLDAKEAEIAALRALVKEMVIKCKKYNFGNPIREILNRPLVKKIMEETE